MTPYRAREILGVSKGGVGLGRAFYQQCKLYHPDKPNGDESRFREIKEAYELLKKKETFVSVDNLWTIFQKNAAKLLNNIKHKNLPTLAVYVSLADYAAASANGKLTVTKEQTKTVRRECFDCHTPDPNYSRKICSSCKNTGVLDNKPCFYCGGGICAVCQGRGWNDEKVKARFEIPIWKTTGWILDCPTSLQNDFNIFEVRVVDKAWETAEENTEQRITALRQKEPVSVDLAESIFGVARELKLGDETHSWGYEGVLLNVDELVIPVGPYGLKFYFPLEKKPTPDRVEEVNKPESLRKECVFLALKKKET